MHSTLFFRLIACLWLCFAAQAHALTAEQAMAMAAGETDDRVAAVQQAVAEPGERTAAFLQALADDAVKIAAGKALIVRDDKGQDPVTGAEVPVPADAEDIINNNRMRGEIDTALAGLALFGKDEARRMAAAKALTREPDAGRLPLLDKALAQETSDRIKTQLELARAATLLGSDDAAQRIAAAQALSLSATPDTRLLLNERATVEEDAKVKAALQAALRAIDGKLAWGERLGAAFSGISLGSILLLVALGLAITYGLMGVINMAHGELMMIGAYATYVVQGIFQKYFPGAFDWYLVAAVPLAFAASACVGAVLERSVLRFLYGRPLETLLATWGISLVLMQLVRTIFGAQNVGVENPAWMSGGVQVLSNLTLPYNRLVIIGFAIAVLLGMGYLIARTRLGSGIAGLAGCALSQVGNVGPDLGQSYIVDAFMVVVLGGVGQLAGTVYAALGLGILNKFLEGWAGAVLAKIAVLVFIIIFIQKRPQGIFAVKGRTAD